jgi:hypothetical protein
MCIAARAMYSYARRIQKVAPTSNIHLEAISSQAQAYLAAINALHLVDPKNAWIVIEDDENMLSVVSLIILVLTTNNG